MREKSKQQNDAEGVLAQLLGNPLARILRSAGVGTWSWDIATDVFSWSVGTANKTGTPHLRFESIEELVAFAHPEDRAELRAATLATRTSGSDLHHRFRYQRADGGFGRVLIDGICVGPGVPPAAVVGMSRDDTEEMDAETALAQLFDERHRVAQALETALLPPSLPSVPGLLVDAAYQSSEGASTGDFYDLFPLGKGEWGLTIGDVGGHGPAAAAITAAVRYALRAAALVRRRPARVVQAANKAHLAATEGERFTTCHFVRMSTSTDGKLRVKVATAGHPSLLVRRVDGTIEELGGSGPMLGMLNDPEFVEASGTLHPGDLLVAYTDGLTEARRQGEEFGDDRLHELIRDWNGPIKGMADHLQESSSSFSGELQDDIATVILQVAELSEAQSALGGSK